MSRMMLKMKEQFMRIRIFSEFDYDELAAIERYFTLKRYKKGDVVIEQNSIKKELFIIIEGKIVSTMVLPETIEKKQKEYGPGDFFGEMSLLGERPSFDTFVAEKDSHLFTLQEKELELLIEKSPVIAVKFITQLLTLIIQRLRDSSKFLADVVQWGEDASRRSITDNLTGIYNRTFLEDALVNFFNTSKSNNKNLSLIMLDIDNFRKTNDILGDEAGNNIILDSVKLINDIISKHGIMARYGGDEFSILLPEANLESALKIAEDIRMTIEKHDFSKYLQGKDIPITTSIGVSSFPETATDFNTFKDKADKSLLKAKDSGRNRVVSLE